MQPPGPDTSGAVQTAPDAALSAPPPAWAAWVVRARWAVLAGLALVTALAGLSAVNLGFDFSPDSLFAGDSADFAYYQHTHKPMFGAGDMNAVLIVEGPFVTADGAPGPAGPALKDAHAALARIQGVQGVVSLVGQALPASEGGALITAPAIDASGVVHPGRFAAARRNPLVHSVLVSPEGTLALAVARFSDAARDEDSKRAMTEATHAAAARVRAAHPAVRVHVAGLPLSQTAIVDTLKRDQLRFVPFTVLLMGALLFLSFRHLRGVALPFVATGLATVWALGLLVLRGHHINIVNNAMVVLLLVIGIADAVHIVARFDDEYKDAHDRSGGAPVDKHAVVARTLAAMVLPCFLTTTTTAVGFASSLIAEVGLLREFGVDAALGVLGAFFATVLVVPALLAVLPAPSPRAATDTRDTRDAQSGLARGLAWLGAFSARHAWAIVAAGLVLTGLSAAAMRTLSANQYVVSELPESDPTVRGQALLERELSGLLPFDVVFAGPPEALRSPDATRAAAAIAAWIRAHPQGHHARSTADVYAALDRALRAPGATAQPVQNWDNAHFAQLDLLLDMNSPGGADDTGKNAADIGLRSTDGRHMRVQGMARDVGSSAFAGFLDALRPVVAQHTPAGVTARITGGQVIATHALGTVMRDMSTSLLLASALIFAFTLLLFRSPTLAAIAMAPNLLPILVTLGAMAVLGIGMRVATVVIFSMSLGIAVDACIHMLTRLREEHHAAPNDPVDALLSRTLTSTGRPIVYTTLLLLVGFSVMLLSDFGALRDFALLSGLTLGTALIVDITLLPALIVALKPRLGRGERD